MISIPNYRVEQEVHASASSVVVRARRESDGLAVVIKLLREECAGREALARLKREHAILKVLAIPEAPRAVALEQVGRTLALVVEDSGGEPVDAVARRRGLGTAELLRLAIAIARAVRAVHAKRVIHKDLKPEHLLLDAAGAIQIIDFGISTELAQERCPMADPDALEGTLAYIAPEQTGRMNLPVDRRSDLYALGVSLFELATGRLPFTAKDPLELVHCHIARSAPRADAIRPSVPAAVASILEKLMAKAAEDRYQSAAGLQADLERCLAELEARGSIAPFELGAQDSSESLQIPQKLYGRAQALAVLQATFDQARAGTPQVLLISGPSGIGKSALVLQLRRQLVLRGQLVSGKFDQLSRSEPYSALAAACRELVRGVLKAPPAALEAKRRALLDGLGANARLIIDLVPELELVVGPQEPPSALGPSEARLRFEQVFVSFLGALAPADEPLAIFLDDLQWADPASLRLIRRVVTALRRPILLIGAYRDTEVSGVHPLLLELQELEASGAAIARVRLDPLGPGEIAELLADALRRPAPEVRTLAAVLMQKTRGNPFHLGQFLLELARDGLVRPDDASRRWAFDLVAIEACGIATNAADLVLERLRTLSPNAQRILGLGACIGHEFDSKTIALIAELDGAALVEGLTSALREGALIPLDEHYRYLAHAESAGELNARFRFAHDRVQQAAYALIEAPHGAAVHLRNGRLLRGGLGEKPSDEQLFAVAQQMNRGAALITDPAERDWLAELNLRCAKKAQATDASAVAAEHAAQALALVGERGWSERYELTFAARLTQAECEYLGGAHERALAILDDVDAHARGAADSVAAANLRTTVLVRLGRLPEACRTSAASLRRLGAEAPDPDDKAALGEAIGAEFAAVQALLAGRDIESLAHLPEMTDPLQLLEIRTVTGIIPAAYQSNPELMVLVVLKATRLTIQHGAADQTSFLLGLYAIAHLAITGDHATAYRFGRLGLEVGRSRTNLAATGPALFLFAGFVSHWIDPVAKSLDHFAQALRRCLELGDVLHASYCVGLAPLYQIHAGVPLPEVRAGLPAAFETIERMGDVINREFLVVSRRAIASLAGECEPFGAPAGEGVESAPLAQVPGPVIPWLHAAQAMVRFHAGQYAAALAAATKQEPNVGLVGTVDLRFYAALSHAALARATSEGAEREEHLRRLRGLVRSFEQWAALCPANFAHRRALLAAEEADLEGEAARALDLYEEAMAGAKSQGFLQNQALAAELCGEFHLRARRPRLGRDCLVEAVFAYERWGAAGKVRQLLAKHEALDLGAGGDGDLARTAAAGPKARQRRTSTLGKSASVALDLESAMRATQAITGELESDKLLDRLLRILLENAGAQRGVLIEPRGGELAVEAERTLEPDEVRLRNGAALSAAEVPEQVIRYVARSRETVVLGDAGADPGSFAEDGYFRSCRPRSVLCVALLHQGQLGAVVYLENRAAAHAFSPARVSRIQFLAAHAASALANSRLYEQVQAARRDLEERVRARTLELRQRNSDLKGIFDAVRQGLLTLDRSGRVVGEASAAAAAWFGPTAEGSAWSEALARVDASYARAFAASFADVVRGAEPLPALLERMPRRLAAKGRVLDLELRPVGGGESWARMLVVISDATDEESRKRLELELRHAQKLEAVGQLAAGIAHEINTPAQFVGDNLAFLAESLQEMDRVLDAYRRALAELARLPGGESLAQDVARAEEEADLAYIEENAPAAVERAKEGISRISTLVSAMKEFAHPDRREKDMADLNRALRTALVISKNEYKYVADVEEDYGELPLVKCHLSDVNQVFLNLLVNAAHAVGEVVAKTGAKGRIRVRTRREGDSVRISIEDTGCGIREEIRDRVFDPFFTTKPVGKGTGQGLAIARSIVVDKHGGSLTFVSEVGKGTTFTLVLPVEGREPAAAAPRGGAPTEVPAAR